MEIVERKISDYLKSNLFEGSTTMNNVSTI